MLEVFEGGIRLILVCYSFASLNFLGTAETGSFCKASDGFSVICFFERDVNELYCYYDSFSRLLRIVELSSATCSGLTFTEDPLLI